MFCCFHSAHPLWPGVQKGCSEQCVSHQVHQDAHWLPTADRSHPGQSAVGKLTFLLAPWPWWEVKCVAGSSQHWHSTMRRRSERRRRKRTRPEGERFCWPVTRVPVLVSPLSPPLAGVMTASLGRFTPCFTCNGSLCLVSCYKVWRGRVELHEILPRLVCQSRHVCVFSWLCSLFEMATRPISHRPLLSSQRCLATICPLKRENKNQRMLANVLKCSNEYFRHKGPLSQPAFAWLSPPNSPFKVKWWGLS